MIQCAEQIWDEIQSKMVGVTEISLNYLAVKKERLKNLLEDVRLNIEESLKSGENILEDCKISLERLLQVSEKLRVSYVSPEYMESYYIMDTLKTIRGMNAIEWKNWAFLLCVF